MQNNRAFICPCCGKSEYLWNDAPWKGCRRCGYFGNLSRMIKEGSAIRAAEFDRRNRPPGRIRNWLWKQVPSVL